MIRVRVELDQYGLGLTRKGLAEIHIANDGCGSKTKGHYDVWAYTCDGNGERHERAHRMARVEDWPREGRSVTRLVAQALKELGYVAS